MILLTRDNLIKAFIDQQLAQWHLSGFMIGMFAWYCALFCVGLIGNVWVISLLIYILKNLHLSNSQNIFIYILCLSCVDSLVVVLLPILVSDMILMHWIFGKAFCKIYLILESTNKMISTFILAALSFDRYLAICQANHTYTIRTSRGTLMILAALIGFVVVLLMPVYLYAKEMEIDEWVNVGNQTYNISLPKCMLDMNGDLLLFFTTYIFSIGFCLPSVLIICFYTMVLYHIYRHARSVGGGLSSQIPVKRVTRATLMIVLFYFACWAPYWTSTMYQALAPPDSNIAAQNNPTLAKMFFVIHSFVYVNSSLNWVFYAFLNKNLRSSHDLAVERVRSNRFSRMDSSTTISTQNMKLTNPSLKDELLLVFKMIEEDDEQEAAVVAGTVVEEPKTDFLANHHDNEIRTNTNADADADESEIVEVTL